MFAAVSVGVSVRACVTSWACVSFRFLCVLLRGERSFALSRYR